MRFQLEEERDAEMMLEGELVELHDAKIRSISVNAAVIEPDLDRNVEIPVDEIIAGYLRRNLGTGFKLEGEQLSVDAADTAEADNTKPITSAAVYTELGNINAVLQTI